MRHRHAPPRLWLMTDERAEATLWLAIARLPRGAGIVFRHHGTPPAQRRALFKRVRRIARARRLTLVLAGSPRLARGWGADGVHGVGAWRTGLLRTAPAHDRRAFLAARRAGAEVIFVSPAFPTRSHPGTPTLGPMRFAAIAQGDHARTIALGGMDAGRFRRLSRSAIGWAAIDAWSAPDNDQKR